MAAKPDARPVVIISRRGADRIRAGHVWVYRSDIVEAKDVQPGALVTVQELSDKNVRPTRPLPGTNVRPARPPRTLGTAFYSTASQIALRMISLHPVGDVDQLLRERIRDAIAYRERFVENTNAYRVVFSEGDLLPGLIVDRYNDILSMQVLTQAMDLDHIRSGVVSELKEKLQPAAIVEKVDVRVRQLEQLPYKESGLIFGQKTSTEFQMNGVRFLYEALGGQKTGAFLDQRENYAAAEKYARGEALDVFCYQGGFGLHLARTCEKVTGVDSSLPALEIAEKNAQLNGREIEWIEANAFDLLRDYSDQGKKYDCIVLDPPAFAKSKRDLATALRGYKELNLRALKMLRPGGILVTCSCSYHVSASDLLEVVASAAQDLHRIVRILENRGQSKDHPTVLGIPETAYLKCLLAIVS
ncbi:MAG: SAM-dependent methyltransferase [Acidobacteriaceae bacterium]|nr:SAM-dependent methyltransferase [Acidobacteriaceae bacterium]